MSTESTATAPLPRHRILHLLRRDRESRHREMVYRYAVNHPFLYQPDINDLDHLAADMTLEQADHCCNKSVAIYIMSERRCLPDLLLEMLHNYLYDKWLLPYRGELEYGQFLAKTIVPKNPSLPTGVRPRDVIDIIIPVHATISNRTEEARLTIQELDPACLNDALVLNTRLPKKYWIGIRRSRSLLSVIQHQQFFILQPLFRALAIVIRNESFSEEIPEIDQLSVLLIRTGAEEGLSAPISFEPIDHQISGFTSGSCGESAIAVETTLGTAVDFVMNLEKREVAAFGPRPDPVASTQDLEDGCFRDPLVRYEAQQLGWGDEPLVGPRSQWVDPEKGPEWTGWSEREVRRWSQRVEVARSRLAWYNGKTHCS